MTQKEAPLVKNSQVDAAVIASETRYRRLFEAAKDGILILDASTGEIVDVNPYLLGLLGYTRGEVVGSKLWELGPLRDVADSRDTFWELQKTGYIHYEDLPLETKYGRAINVEFVSNSYQVDGVNVIQCNIRDITERKLAEAQAKTLLASVERERSWLAALINSMSDEVWFADAQKRFTLANRSARKEFGIDPSAAIPVDVLAASIEVLRPDGSPRPLDEAPPLRALAGEYVENQEEIVRTPASGTLRYRQVSAAPVKDTSGAIIGSVSVARDITEHKLLEEQLRQSQKMEAVGTLAGGVAHDFNNLLQAMMSLTQVMQAHLHDPAKLARHLVELTETVRRGAHLTQQLLLFSRREVSRLVRLDLNEVVRDAAGMLRRLLRANVQIDLALAARSLPIQGDRSQLDQVLINLAVNAADAMPEGGHLTVSTGWVPDESVWLSMRDTGGGIPEGVRAHIFEPFFTTKALGHGTGLGLSVVHGIVTRHGGRIEVSSRPGHGSSFRITLPWAGVAEDAESIDNAATGPALQGRGERVLIVEDEPTARESFQEILTLLGYHAVSVGSGEEAGALDPEHPFDLLITDYMLPGITGTELARGLQDRWPDLRVILMSGYTQDKAVCEGVGQGSARYLQKPFDADTLARELRAALDKRSAGSPS